MELQSILDEFSIKCDVRTILDKWSEPNRFCHDIEHLSDLISQINEDYGNDMINSVERKKLIITALFHRVINDLGTNDNEERSADMFYNLCSEQFDIDVVEIKQMILDTKNHIASTPLSEKFISYDMNIYQRGFGELLTWEKNLREEHSTVDIDVYKSERLVHLENLLNKYPNNIDNLLDLIKWVKDNY